MRIVGIRRNGGVEVASLSDDGAQVTVVAGLEDFWADAAAHLSREVTGETLPAADVEFVPPVLWVPEGDDPDLARRPWRMAGPPVGFPAGKTKCMSKKGTGLIKCHQLAETPGKLADPNANGCVTKVVGKFDGGISWSRKLPSATCLR